MRFGSLLIEQGNPSPVEKFKNFLNIISILNVNRIEPWMWTVDSQTQLKGGRL